MSNLCLAVNSRGKIKKNDLFADEKTLAKTLIECFVKIDVSLAINQGSNVSN